MNKKRASIIFSFIGGVLIIGIGLFNHFLHQLRIEKDELDYPSIKIADSFSGSVNYIYSPPYLRTSPFVASIDFQEGYKRTIHVNGKSLSNSQVSIRDVCKYAASVEKLANSDTLKVKYFDREYAFLLYREIR